MTLRIVCFFSQLLRNLQELSILRTSIGGFFFAYSNHDDIILIKRMHTFSLSPVVSEATPH